MDDRGYSLYELACDCIGQRISEISAQLECARRQTVADHILIDELKRRSSALWMERHKLSFDDNAAVEACLLAHSACPDRVREVIALLGCSKVGIGVRKD